MFRHPIRNSIREEVEDCLANGKIAEPDRLQTELDYQTRNDFTDDAGLVETTIILKYHRHELLADPMRLWWKNFERFGTRDQIGLPFVLWTFKVPCFYHSFNFRDKNPYFGLYAHQRDARAPRNYAYIGGRSYDSYFYAFILRTWHFFWDVRRFMRRMSRRNPRHR